MWESTLGKLRGRLAEETYATWLEPIRFDGIEGRAVRLRIPNRFFADWISARYLPDILESLISLTGTAGLDVTWVVDASLQEQVSSAGQVVAPLASADRASDLPGSDLEFRTSRATADRRATARASRPPMRANRAAGELPFDVDVHASAGGSGRSSGGGSTGSTGGSPTGAASSGTARAGGTSRSNDSGPMAEQSYALNPRYVFDNFVVGPSNQLAHAASVAASSSPGKRYNPLFIYSKVGLGKTHLINAVGHRVLEDRPEARVLFLSAERFTNEFIWALQHKRIDEFRARYRGACDVLVIDDIQFLAGREQTQEEFFHTFNALYHADKQIVVTSDVYPQHIHEMQERLISRFQWGLVADIQAPELDTRIAILRKKAEAEEIDLPDDVALLMAQVVQSNVRELEGTLLRLTVFADSMGKPLDIEVARSALGAQLPKDRAMRQTSCEDVQRAACEYFQIGVKELMSDRRHRNVSLPRMIAMYVCRERLELSYPMIGQRFGNKDHTTVMNAHRKIKGLAATDERVQRAIEVIERKVGLI
ncbi:MAG: chromosomal replication initiator protein DnaA [Myxococcota bacterium]|nr:chromosomal replication initiator protein DnaA [Myxococcota bacterium]